MITDSMNYKDIVGEYKKEKESGFFLKSFFCDKKLERFFRKNYKHSKEYIRIPPRKLVSPITKNTTLAIGGCYGYNGFKKGVYVGGLSIIFRRKEGLWCVIGCQKNNIITPIYVYHFYTPHFFDRYRERFLKDPTIPKIEVIERFFTNNIDMNVESIEIPGYVHSKYTTTKDGVLLGKYVGNINKNETIIQHNTFITYDMLFPNQESLAKGMNESLLEFIKDEEEYQKSISCL